MGHREDGASWIYLSFCFLPLLQCRPSSFNTVIPVKALISGVNISKPKLSESVSYNKRRELDLIDGFLSFYFKKMMAEPFCLKKNYLKSSYVMKVKAELIW